MSLNKILLSVALSFGFCAPALAEAPESMMIAQAKTKAKGKSIKTRRRGKKVAKKKVAKKKAAAKKAAPSVEVAGELQVERNAKGVIKAAHVVTEGGEKVHVVLNPKGRSLAKLGGAMKVTGKVETRKGVKFIRVETFAASATPGAAPVAAEVPEPVEQPAAVVADDAPADDAPADDAPADDAPADDAPADDAPADDAPADDGGDDAPADDDGGDNPGE